MSSEPNSEQAPLGQLEPPGASNQYAGTSIITYLVIIKTGKFANHLARISSLMNNRYNLQIINDDGKPKRKEDQSTKSTALVRSGFDILDIEPPTLLFGSIRQEDLPAVLTELNKKRAELQLRTFGSEAIESTSSFYGTSDSATGSQSFSVHGSSSAPASAPGGSPMSKSKLKTKASVDEVEQRSAEDGEESRNNLYWAEVDSRSSSSVRYGYVCLWYGGTFTDTVQVLPISPKMPVYSSSNGATGIAMSSSGFSSPIVPSGWGTRSSLTDAITSESGAAPALSTTPLSGSRSFNELARKPLIEARGVDGQNENGDGTGTAESSESEYEESENGSHSVLLNVPRHFLRSVRRSDLSPLDEDLINAKYAHMPEDDPYRHFLLAMLAFPEWDYPQRDSYIWPDFALALMRNPTAQDMYIRTAQSHPLNNGVRPFSDVILFLLCAEQTGVLEEWSDELYAQGQQCTDGVQALLDNISDFRRSDEEIFRFTCRVADCFQASALPALRDQLCPSDLAEETIAHSGGKISDAMLEEYLSQVQSLREGNLRVNQLVEAPLSVEQFSREWEAHKANSVRAGQSVVTAASSKHATRTALEAFIATSRREKKKLTALFTVKQPACSAFVAAFSPPAGAKNVAVVTASSGSSRKAAQGTAPASDMVDDVERLIPSSDVVVKSEPKKIPEVVDLSDSTAMEIIDSASEAENSKFISSSSTANATHLVSPLSTSYNQNHKAVPAAGAMTATTAVATLAGAAAALPERVEDFVVLTFGTVDHRVPLRLCRIPTLPEDIALEILHACEYDVPKALEVVAAKLRSDSSSAASATEAVKSEPGVATESIERVFCKDNDITLNRRIMSAGELDQFHGVVNRFNNDLQSIFAKFNKYLAKQALRARSLNSNISSLDKVAGPYFFSGPESSASNTGKNGALASRASDGPFDGSEFNPRSMKEILALFFLFYPGLDDERIPLMTTFNSPLFRAPSWNSVASSVMAYGQSGSAQQSGGLTGKKPSSGLGRGRPRKEPRESRDPLLPNRWPPNLPAIQHNLYWLADSNTPCLCTGLDIRPKTSEVKLNMISINSEAHRMLVLPNKVVPLNDDLMKRSNDERSVAFASAMMQFVEWEFKHHIPATSQLHKWYVYPPFITQMLLLTSRWLGWRKQADRHPRATTMSRRDCYLHALIEDYQAIPAAQHSDRYYNSSLPWNDTPLSSEPFGGDESAEESDHDADGTSGIESFSEREDEGGEDYYFGGGEEAKNSFGPRQITASGGRRPVGRPLKKSPSNGALDGSNASDEIDLFADQAGLGAAPKKRGRPSLDANQGKNSRSKTSLASEAEFSVTPSVEDPRSKPPALRSFYNMFWIPRSQLPCLYYDTPENRHKDRFKIIPICCLTYHYPFMIDSNNKGSIEPLQMSHLKSITDERTAEFTHALIEYARKENERRKTRAVSELASDTDLVLGGSMGGEFEGVGDDDANSLHDASMLQPHELFDWPEFILQLVNQPTMWHSWRKRAERSGSGLKRHQYLRALQVTQDEVEEKEKAEMIAAKKTKQHVVVPPAPGLHIRSHFNLFWLLRSNLPAIYYDSPGNRDKDKFTVLPINCSAYQYPMQVKGSAVVIEALSTTNLARCTEDRTHEFTLALLDFAAWELAERRAMANPQKDLYFLSDDAEYAKEDAAGPESTDLYDWPDFILQMLNSPDQWSTWRKKAERSSSRDTKRTVYFKALVEDFRRSLAGSSGSAGASAGASASASEGSAMMVTS